MRRLEEVVSQLAPEPRARSRRVVAAGGGTGLPRVLAGLAGCRDPRSGRALEVTALVTTADDGGARASCAAATACRHRATSGGAWWRSPAGGAAPWPSSSSTASRGRGLAGHTVGNVLLTALAQRLGGFGPAVEAAAELLGARGRVVPSVEGPAELVAELEDGRQVRGESASPRRAGGSPRCASPARRTRPARRSRRSWRRTWWCSGRGACTRACSRACSAAGSPRRSATTAATRVLCVNLFSEPGETDGLDAADHVRAVQRQLGDVVDVALAHRGPLPPRLVDAFAARGARPVAVAREAVEALGPAVVLSDLLAADDSGRHDPRKLAGALLGDREPSLRRTHVLSQTALHAAAPGPLAYRVEALEGRAAFDALHHEWNALLARGPVDLPFVRHEWIAAWLDAFAPAARLRVLAARDPGGAAAGFAPLLEVRDRGVIRLVAPANDHSCRVERALGPDAEGAVAALWAHLRDRLRWDVLLLRDLPREGPTSTLLEPLARADGHLTGRWESLRTPYLPLGDGPVEARTSAKFRANLRRRSRRLAGLGAVAVQREDGRGDLDGALAAFLELEAAGWKGPAAPPSPRPGRARFYTRVARARPARARWPCAR